VKPPPRLIDGDDLRAHLLRSARADVPSGRSRRRATAAIAVALGALASRSAAALAAATVTRSALVKALLGVGAVTLVAAGARDAPTTTDARVDAPVVVRSQVTPPPVPWPAPTPVAASALSPAPAPAPAPAALAPASASTAPSRPLGLADEVALLARAQRALEAGETASAFAALSAHDRLFPRGTLGQEAAVLRIEATARSGNRATARSLARSFEATYPGSPFRDRLRALLGDAP
jgi:hypothetical protein